MNKEEAEHTVRGTIGENSIIDHHCLKRTYVLSHSHVFYASCSLTQTSLSTVCTSILLKLMCLNKQPPFPQPGPFSPSLSDFMFSFSTSINLPFGQIKPQHSWTAMCTIPHLDMPKPSESGFISKTLDPCCPLWCSHSWIQLCCPPKRDLIFSSAMSSSASCPWCTQHRCIVSLPSRILSHVPLRLCSPSFNLLAHISYPHCSTQHLPVIYTYILSCCDKPLLPIYLPSIIHPSTHSPIHPSIHPSGWEKLHQFILFRGWWNKR